MKGGCGEGKSEGRVLCVCVRTHTCIHESVCLRVCVCSFSANPVVPGDSGWTKQMAPLMDKRVNEVKEQNPIHEGF